jgi:predicted RNA-binding protein with PUA-like domain
MSHAFWLLKSEPSCYSILDLKRDGITGWDGVRNYQARNFMKNDMKIGDLAFFYHSNADPSGIAGVARICKLAYPDTTALDPTEDHYDPKSTPDNPIWWRVDIEFNRVLDRFIPLKELHTYPELSGMEVLKKGSRLSITPVEKKHFDFILSRV